MMWSRGISEFGTVILTLTTLIVFSILRWLLRPKRDV